MRLNPFLGLNFSQGFDTIYRNYDGAEYITIARSWYDSKKVAQIPQSLPLEYFPSHFPGYSIFIALFAPLMGHLKSMLFVTQLFTVLSALAFYKLVKDFHLSQHPLVLSALFLILPARWLIVHSVGSSEPMFIFATISAIYCFLKFEQTERLSWVINCALFASLAQLTRPPGILLFLALVLYLKLRHWEWIKSEKLISLTRTLLNFTPLLLIPLTLLLIFYWFQVSLGDFWAYFHSGDNIHLTLPLFPAFNKDQFWVGDIWLEDIIYTLILGYLAAFRLLKTAGLRVIGVYVLIYLLAGSFIAHRDISRYLLPVAPFALIAFEKILISREFRLVIVVLALAIYLYSQNFILGNTAPINNLPDFN